VHEPQAVARVDLAAVLVVEERRHVLQSGLGTEQGAPLPLARALLLTRIPDLDLGQPLAPAREPRAPPCLVQPPDMWSVPLAQSFSPHAGLCFLDLCVFSPPRLSPLEHAQHPNTRWLKTHVRMCDTLMEPSHDSASLSARQYEMIRSCSLVMYMLLVLHSGCHSMWSSKLRTTPSPFDAVRAKGFAHE
jgi:hypothetical protein